MNNLPDDILIKIMMFNSHPIADIIKESTIFQYISMMDNDGVKEEASQQFKQGFRNSRSGDYLDYYIRAEIYNNYEDHDEPIADEEQAIHEYDIGCCHAPEIYIVIGKI